MNLISSHSTLHTLYPNIILKLPGTPYRKAQAENSVKADNKPSPSIDAFIDEVLEREETVFFRKTHCHINI